VDIAPGDTAADLLVKLQNIPALAVEIDADGNLRMRPGDDDTFTSQSFGGDIEIIGGPFATSNAAYVDTAAPSTRTGIDDNVNIASALFGTYTSVGGIISNSSAIYNVNYGSEISAANNNEVGFRSNMLGPDGSISTDIIGSNRLIDYAQKMVNQHASEIVSINNAKADEESLRDILQTQFMNESGVNLDEELSNLIVFQTAFSASARVVNAVDEMFQELLNAF